MKNSVLRYVSALAMALMLAVWPLEARSDSARDNNRGGSRGTHRTERTRSESNSRSSERKSSNTSRNAGTRSNNTRTNRDNVQKHNDNRGNHSIIGQSAGHSNGRDNGTNRGNGILQGNRGGAAGNRPVIGNGNHNNANRPGNGVNNGNHNGGNNRPGNVRPGNGGGFNNGHFNNGGHGNNHFGPGSPGIARPPKHHGHYAPVPPAHPYRYTMQPPRPVPPGHYRPYIGPRPMSLGQAVLAFTLGSAFNVALDYFFDNGYSVGGFGNDVIYLNNVSMFNYIWPETSLFYNNGMLATQQYCYASPYNDRARFNSIYRDMCRVYGNPYMRNLPSGLSATWMSGTGDYITLEYQPTYSPAGVLNFFTTLTFGL